MPTLTPMEVELAKLGPKATTDWVKANCKRVLSFKAVLDAIKAAIPVSQTYVQVQNDTIYHYPTAQQLVDLAACRSGVPVCPWIEEYMDCDDFAFAYKGWLSKVGLGTLTIGLCAYSGFDANGRYLGKHALLAAVDSGNKAWLIEPQDGKVYAPSQYGWPGTPTVASKQLLHLIF